MNTKTNIGKNLVKSIASIDTETQKEFQSAHYTLGFIEHIVNDNKLLNDKQKTEIISIVISYHNEQSGKGSVY